MEYYSPLRYPGGKGKIASVFKRIFQDNLLFDGVYIEPYAGGASVAISLLVNQYAERIIINDIDPAIHAFWYCVLSDTENLCKLITDTPVTVVSWKKQRDVQRNSHAVSPLELGFSTFFLNRTNRSGILNAGIIGGANQQGKWKIDARYNKIDLVNRIQRIARLRDKIALFNLDAGELIRFLKPNLPRKSLIYFDPPYCAKGKDLYLNHYTSEDHLKISEEIKSLGSQRWIVTYDSVAFIRKLYSGFRQLKYQLAYTAKSFSTGEEIMIFSAGLYVPLNLSKMIV